MLPVLDADTPPDVCMVCRELQLRVEQVSHTVGTLRENLKRMPVGCTHNLRNLDDVVIRHIFMEKIAHGVDKDQAGRLPLQGFLQLLRHEPQVKPSLIGMAGDATESLRENLRITVLAPRTDLRAAANGVPSRVCPLDF